MSTVCTGTPEFIKLCTGDNLVNGVPVWQIIRNWNVNWSDDCCFQVFDDIMFTVPGNPIRTYNPIALREVVQPLMTLILNRFNGMYSIATPDVHSFDETGIAASELQDRILSACSRLPGACDIFLDGPILINEDLSFSMPAPFCQTKTRDEVANNKAFLEFCGCFSAPIVNTKVEQELGGVKSCDPLCSRVSTIQLPDGKGGFLECPDDTVCVINDISITAAQSEVGGGINFDQICACKENCRCVIESEASIEETLSKIGLSGNFEQLCGKNSACIIFNPKDDVDKYVTCPESGGPSPIDEEKFTILFWTIAVVAVVVLAIIGLFIGLSTSERRRRG